MKIPVAVLLLFSSLGSLAQKFESGVIAGFNATQIDGDKLAGYNKIGLNSGVFVYYPFSGKWRLQTEFLYSNKGAKQIIDDNNIGNTTTFLRLNCHYIDIPFLLGYSWKKFNFQAGLSGAYLFKAIREDFSRTSDVTGDLKRGEFAYLLRAEYDLSERWAANAGFSYSLNCVSRTGCDPIWVNPKFRQGFHHNMLTATLRYRFGS